MDAAGIRRDILATARAIPCEELAHRRGAITAAFLSRASFLLNSPLRVGLYHALPGEIDLEPVAIALRRSGADLFYPRITERQASRMEFAHVSDESETHWSIGVYGIREPASHCPAEDPARLDVIFTPAVALSELGERIGRGAGYYDRMLPRAKGALRVALGFDFQVYSTLPQSPWDQRVDWIFAESRDIQLARVQEWRESRGL
jgi:5-formyltetrahydrofolate cyclo-ligase